MALTIAKVTNAPDVTGVGGKFKLHIRTITFDSSYVTAGEPLTAADLGSSGRTIFAVLPHGAFRNTDATLGIIVSYDHTNSKLVAYWGNAGSVSGMPEVASTTDLSTYSGRVTILTN
jgi:hypothetical protein